MGSKTRKPMKVDTRRNRRRPNSFHRSKKSSKRVIINGKTEPCSSVDDKLEALKNLIPAHNINGDQVIKPDELFKETANYIVLLRTRVLFLQKLVDFYGNDEQTQNAV